MGSIEWLGESFELNETVSADALADFAAAASDAGGGDVKSMETVTTVRTMVWDCIAAGDLDRFKAHSRASRAGIEDWMLVFQATMTQETERPTGLPSGSSDGQPATDPKSVASSDDRASVLLAGRPDLQLSVLHTRTG